MRKLVLEPIDNGMIVKTILDDNIDGAGKKLSKKRVFQLTDNVTDTENFLLSLIEDLGLFTGNVNDQNMLSIKQVHGSKYQMNATEISDERKRLSLRLSELKSIKQLNQL